MTLLQFAAAEKANAARPCWLCSIPERKEVEEAREQGVRWSTIIRWLIDERGHPPDDVTPVKLRNHVLKHLGRAAPGGSTRRRGRAA